MFFGPMKEEREEFEVEDTTYEMFNTMINYIYQPPGYHFFPSTHEDDDDNEEEYYGQLGTLRGRITFVVHRSSLTC